MTQHTKGPWTVEFPTRAYNASAKSFIIGNGVVLAEISYGMENENAANARLIAAAPELLELLTLALPYVDEGERFNKSYANKLSDQIRFLLEKADGQ